MFVFALLFIIVVFAISCFQAGYYSIKGNSNNKKEPVKKEPAYFDQKIKFGTYYYYNNEGKCTGFKDNVIFDENGIGKFEDINHELWFVHEDGKNNRNLSKEFENFSKIHNGNVDLHYKWFLEDMLYYKEKDWSADNE